MTQSVLRWLLAVGIVLAAASLVPARAEPSSPEDVTLALPQASVGFSEIYLAEDLGLWAKNGLRVKIVVVTGVGATNAVISGSAEFALSSATSLTRAAAQGQRLLAIAAVIDRTLIQVVLRKDIAVAAGFTAEAPLSQRASLLRGRIIASEGINGIGHAYLRLVAKHGGVNPEEMRIAVMQPPSMNAALGLKQIDGFVTTMPFPIEAVMAGTAVMIASGPDGEPREIVPMAFSSVVTRPEVCATRKTLCQGIGRSIAEAATYIHAYPAEALAFIQKRFAPMSPALIAAAFEEARKAAPDPPVVTRASLENGEKLNISVGLVDPKNKLQSYDGLFTDEYVR
jgi:NitT/TauT family transport system substrate-binding protein